MTAMSRATRRTVVAHLTACRMNPQQIAAELGVSVDTVRRDLREAPPATGAPAAPAARDGDTLTLRLDGPLRASLALLRSLCNGPDTEAQNVAAARAAIHATADHIREQTPTGP